MRRNSSGSIQKDAKVEAKRKVAVDSPSVQQSSARTKIRTRNSKDTPEAKIKAKQGSGGKRDDLLHHENQGEEVRPFVYKGARESKKGDIGHSSAEDIDETFDLMFASMRESLASTISKSDLVTMRCEPDEELKKSRADLEERLHKI